MKLTYIFVGSAEKATDIYKNNKSPIETLKEHHAVTCNSRWLDIRGRFESVVSENVKKQHFLSEGPVPFSIVRMETEMVAIGRKGEPVPLGIVNNPSNMMVTLTKTDNIVPSVEEIYEEEDLVYFDIEKDYVLPLGYGSLGKVLDVYSGNGCCGFVMSVKKTVAEKAIKITGIHKRRCYLFTIPYDHTITEATAKREKKYPKIWQTMRDKKTKWAVTPERKGVIATTVIFYREDSQKAYDTVRLSLDKYRRCKDYGKNIIIHDGTKEETEESWRIQDIHLIKVDTSGKFGKWEERLSKLYGELVATHSTVPIRAASVISSDDIRLPVSFRKKFKIRYVNHISDDGTIIAFITNKY